MISFNLQTPVALIIFNRPASTAKVFNEIRKAKPKELYIIADGPRKDKPDDRELCKQTRKVTEEVDWDCNVYKNYSDENLGCKLRPSSGLDWLFGYVDKAIILEDDCLPHSSFFQFCQILLEFYKDDERVNMISGSNFFSGQTTKNHSYYFSAFHHFWGWATWKRSWLQFDVDMKEWPEYRDQGFISEIVPDPKSVKYWRTLFEEVYSRKINTAWDYQWLFSSWKNKGLAVVPASNLVSNIGFGKNSTHTKDPNHIRANVPSEGISFPLNHPSQVVQNIEYDIHEAKKLFRFKGRDKLVRLAKKLLQV